MMYDPLIKDTVISKWKAIKLNMKARATSHLINFMPNSFQRGFSSSVTPVLHIWPDDTIQTESVDAAGIDKSGRRVY